MELEIPPGALVLLMGVAGSGKSTFARRHFRATQVVSSDACRALISDDEADQTASADAFRLLHTIVGLRLARGRTTVVDATNVQAWGRAPLLDIAKKAGAPLVAIVLDVPAHVWREQNAARQRKVDDAVLAKQAADLETTRAELAGEGFAHVFLLDSREAVRSAKVTMD